MYDLIGDIHGHADELVQLLDELGYDTSGGVYRHSERKVIFLGDFIDRGPKIRQTLEIVRSMVEAGYALAVMGNHEFNALAYHTEDPDEPGRFLRRHSDKNTGQHRKTVEQLKPAELSSYLDWFRTLPLWLELDGLRIVHACWDDRAISQIAADGTRHDRVTTDFLESSCKKGKPLFAPVEIILKGKEEKLPNGEFFLDPDRTPRYEIRTRWYLPPDGHTYRSYAFQSKEIACDLTLDATVIAAASPYPADAKPVFVGHYWLSAEQPSILAGNVACLDYSVAKGGFLCAYRWHGESRLNNGNFLWARVST